MLKQMFLPKMLPGQQCKKSQNNSMLGSIALMQFAFALSQNELQFENHAHCGFHSVAIDPQ